MIAYYGTKISPNQLETGEGFLICKNVPIARVGDMEYMASEMGLKGDGVITVHRSPEDVFSPAALASFEGKPVTSDHPPALITPEDVTMYERGHAQNVRRGTGEFADYVLADLHIHDAELIREIREGKREISCGYECEYVDDGDGTYSQRKIIGNHIAIVDAGRAGHKAAILDKKMPIPAERKKMSKHSVLLSLFGKAATGATPEEVERLAMDTAELMGEEKPAEAAPADEAPEMEAAPADEAPEKTMDEKLYESIDALSAKMDAILEALAPKSEEPAEEPKDPIDEAIEILSEAKEEKVEDEEAADPTGEEAVTVEAEEMNEEAPASMDGATALAILKTLRPAIAGIKDATDRQAVSDAVLQMVRGTGTTDAARIIKAAQNVQKPVNVVEDVQKLYDARNPHKKEVK